MRSLLRAIAFVVLAYAVFASVGAAMLMLPFTPHGRMLQAMRAMDSYRNSSDVERGNAAFDEWLRIGRQADYVGATVLPLIAGIAVILASRFGRPLSNQELIVVVLGFCAVEAWRPGTALDPLRVLGVMIFAATLWVGRVWATRARPNGPAS